MIYLIEFATPEFDEALRLRDAVLREPLGLEFTAEQIAAEYEQVHFGYYHPQQQHLLGCLSLQLLPDRRAKMRQVAVRPEQQGQGIGQALVRAAEAWARAQGYGLMWLHARESAVPFYEKLAYERVGERFEEVNIPHFNMQKAL